MSLLVIEDDDGVRDSIAAILREEGHTVETAGGGNEALRLLRERPLPSLIVLDLMMPGMDGIEFRREQLADPQLRDIPVIIISARPDVALQAAELGAEDFLQKPMSFEELLHLVQNRAVTQVGAPD
ncbi:MAG: two-component response regulator [bacterium]|nr:two-component response regulator [bacterium]